ncbi:hypothetical protein HJC23_004936 [Cyclotella cryptica]|uniref:Dihydrolipoamide acetyltransferase component of pyruvate dehydrogenase complex n=1 Tax=Cyclotella cryptica TaxID=29204 RepID=A0ABD3PTA9_9STRA
MSSSVVVSRMRRAILRPSSTLSAKTLSFSSVRPNELNNKFPVSHHCRLPNNRVEITNFHPSHGPLITLSHRFQSAIATTIPSDDASDVSSTNTLTPFLLADIGEGITEVELLQWYISPGSTVHQFDRVCQVQSDKASVEITSRYDGVVKELCAEVGGVVRVGQPLCFLETRGGNGKEERLSNVVEGERLTVPSVAVDYSKYYEEESFVLTSPAVRKLGKENNIDLSTVKGSGPNGRVLKSDVLRLIPQNGNVRVSNTSSTPAMAYARNNENDDSIPLSLPQEDEIVPIRGYHRLMVKSMVSSLTVPHMVYTDEINVTALQSLRATLKPFAADKGIKLTLLPFFLKAASLALKQFPTINSSIDMDRMELRVHKKHDLGVAVDTERGLVVVVVRGCEGRSVEGIAVELTRLFALQAAEGNLTEQDISNPTFTLSNIGAIGGTYMSPVVLPPQVAIGAMGKIQRLPRFVNDSSTEVEAVQIMPISWGGDHRAIDGATMARFSNAWKYYVENPQAMIFEMR